MVGFDTTTTEHDRRIEEIEVQEHGRLELSSSIRNVPSTTIVEEPGEYLLIRVGDGTPDRESTNFALEDYGEFTGESGVTVQGRLK